MLAPGELQDARALACGRRALSQLRELAREAPELVPSRPEELARALAPVELWPERGPVPGAVAVVDPLALRARRVRALFVCGMQEGVFPARARPHPLFAEEERGRLAQASGLLLDRQPDQLAAERYLFYAAVSRPEEQLVLSWHVGDDDGQPTSRSLFVDDVCDLFGGEDLLAQRRRRALGAVDAPPAAAAPVVARRGPHTLRDERLLGELRERVWSASSLERWLGCPVAWYVERMLAPADFEPEAEPLARGGLAHDALRDTLEGLRAATGSARVTEAALPLALELLRASLLEHEGSRPLSSSPARRAAIARRLRADLERFLEHVASSEGGLEPAELELGFGFRVGDPGGEDATLPPLELGGGVQIKGRIDRIDATPEGDGVVVDYKSSKVVPAARWRPDGSLQVALYMLAVEQLLGRTVRGGLYQPLSGKLQPRGVVEEEAELPLPTAANDVLPRSEMVDLLAWAGETARAIVSEARGGELRARPASCAYRGGCMFPSICRCER